MTKNGFLKKNRLGQWSLEWHSVPYCHLFVLWGRRAGVESCHLIGPAAEVTLLCLHIHLHRRIEPLVHPFLAKGTQVRNVKAVFT